MNARSQGPGARGLDALLALLFAIALGAPSIDALVRTAAERGPAPEQRTAAPEPALEWSTAAWTSYPERYCAWWADSFGLRDKLLRWNSIVELLGFGVSPTPKMIAGRDGWLYYTVDDSVPILRGLLPFREVDLENWRRGLESHRDWCRERKIAYAFAIAPNKETIYPEHLPSALNRCGPTRLEQLLSYLQRHSDLALVDLRPALIADKANDRDGEYVYYPLGTHWTERGALVAYRELARALAPGVPALEPLAPDQFEKQIGADFGDTWAAHMYIGDLLPQKAPVYVRKDGFRSHQVSLTNQPDPLRVAEQDSPRLPRAVLFHDSFGFKLLDFLAEHFAHFVSTHQYKFDTALLEAEKPDVVIELFVERRLAFLPPNMLYAQDPAQNQRLFERSRDVRYRLSLEHPAPAIEGLERTQVWRVAASSTEGAGLAVHVFDGADSFLLPEFALPADGSGVLALELEASQACELDVLFLRAGESVYSRQNQLQWKLERGHNALYLRLQDARIVGRLRVRPWPAPVELVFHGLELRACATR